MVVCLCLFEFVSYESALVVCWFVGLYVWVLGCLRVCVSLCACVFVFACVCVLCVCVSGLLVCGFVCLGAWAFECVCVLYLSVFVCLRLVDLCSEFCGCLGLSVYLRDVLL